MNKDRDYCPDCNKYTWETKYIEELDEEIIFPVECDCVKYGKEFQME